MIQQKSRKFSVMLVVTLCTNHCMTSQLGKNPFTKRRYIGDLGMF